MLWAVWKMVVSDVVGIDSSLFFDSSMSEFYSRWLPLETSCDVDRFGFELDLSLLPLILQRFIQ